MSDNKQTRLDKVYLDMCNSLAQLSYAKRAQVGCIIVSDEGQIISNGYNGTPSGFDNCCEDWVCDCKWVHGCTYTAEELKYIPECDECIYNKSTTKHEVLHAESNAIAKCAKWGGRAEGSTLYVTMSPCYDCAKLIIQAGIKRVVYRDKYRDTSGLKLLKEAKIKLTQIKDEQEFKKPE